MEEVVQFLQHERLEVKRACCIGLLDYSSEITPSHQILKSLWKCYKTDEITEALPPLINLLHANSAQTLEADLCSEIILEWSITIPASEHLSMLIANISKGQSTLLLPHLSQLVQGFTTAQGQYCGIALCELAKDYPLQVMDHLGVIFEYCISKYPTLTMIIVKHCAFQIDAFIERSVHLVGKSVPFMKGESFRICVHFYLLISSRAGGRQVLRELHEQIYPLLRDRHIEAVEGKDEELAEEISALVDMMIRDG